MHLRTLITSAIVSLSLAATACGGDSGPSGPAPSNDEWATSFCAEQTKVRQTMSNLRGADVEKVYTTAAQSMDEIGGRLKGMTPAKDAEAYHKGTIKLVTNFSKFLNEHKAPMKAAVDANDQPKIQQESDAMRKSFENNAQDLLLATQRMKPELKTAMEKFPNCLG